MSKPLIFKLGKIYLPKKKSHILKILKLKIIEKKLFKNGRF